MDLVNLFCRSCWKWSICFTSKFLFMVKKIHLIDLIVQFLKVIHTVRWELLFFDKARSFKVHSVKWEIDRVRIFKFEEFIKFITLRKWAARLFISMNDRIVIIGLNSFLSLKTMKFLTQTKLKDCIRNARNFSLPFWTWCT